MKLFIDRYPRYSTWADCMIDIIDVLSTAKRFDDAIHTLNEYARENAEWACSFFDRWFEDGCELDYQRYVECSLSRDIYETFAVSIRYNPYCTYKLHEYSSPYPYILNYAAIQAARDNKR